MSLEDRRRDGLSRITGDARRDVRVQIERDANRRVAETLGHDFRMDARLECERRVGVAQVVQPDAGQAGVPDKKQELT